MCRFRKAAREGSRTSLAMDIVADMLLEEGIHARPEGFMMDAEHTFSHIHWNLQVYRCREEEMLSVAESGAVYAPDADHDAGAQRTQHRWINEEDMELYAFPNVFLRILKEHFKGKRP